MYWKTCSSSWSPGSEPNTHADDPRVAAGNTQIHRAGGAEHRHRTARRHRTANPSKGDTSPQPTAAASPNTTANASNSSSAAPSSCASACAVSACATGASSSPHSDRSGSSQSAPKPAQGSQFSSDRNQKGTLPRGQRSDAKDLVRRADDRAENKRSERGRGCSSFSQ